MEKRLILAIVLSFLILFLFQLIFVKPQPAPPVPVETGTEAAAVESQPAGDKIKQAEKPASSEQAAEGGEVITSEREQEIIIDTPLYTAIWSNRGGVIKSWKSKNHLKKIPSKKNPEREPLDLVPETALATGIFPFSLQLDDQDVTDLANNSLYRVNTDRLELSSDQKGQLIFEYSDGNKVKIKKQLSFDGQNFSFKTSLSVEINGRQIEPLVLWGPGIGTLSPEEMKEKFSANRGAVFLVNHKAQRLPEKKLKPLSETVRYSGLGWSAYEENYFAAIFLLDPIRSQSYAFRLDHEETSPDGQKVVVPYFYLAFTHPTEAYIGPKEYDRLKAYGHEVKKVINFGFFGFIAEFLLIVTKFLYKFFPNWGIAIIIMTFIIKILLFPLTYSSTKSMAKMQEIQPKIKALQAKYKKAKQDMEQRRQLNEEMMKLYKEHGINPAGGCLPLLIQLPIFWGFFRMLVVAVELRHSPFVFWIKDLSVKDPYYITPILMGITQYISQKMTPSSADPGQQKIMLLMPFIFTIFFMNFQAGLVLYWLTSNVLQIAQQAIMNKMMARKREKDGKRSKKKSSKRSATR
ncbi:MAG TPA: membrane protein insertase YidC [Candidatus Saccharicenans sp.]|nr:membrane protein insertase YidC [Candidatus Saccharicenans sp.]HRD01447.1 membrane protein insertase YidC [Candidatus Saccharicenans sp.]